MLQTLTNKELAHRLGLSDHQPSEGDGSEPLPWGIARLIRRELRRRGLRTRRELRNSLATFLSASGFDKDAGEVIRDVADRMVVVGELADIRVENQRGYAVLPSCWIELSGNDAVLLGTVCMEQHRFQSHHPQQYLRRFCPSDSIVSDLDRIGVKRQSFTEWYGPAEWLRLARADETLTSLADLWSWHVSQLHARGAPLDLQNTKILAIAPEPGAYFGRPWKPGRTRWTKPADLPDGCYLAAQPGHRERQWHPLVIAMTGGEARSLLIGQGLSSIEAYDLQNWLLLARAEAMGVREKIMVDTRACEIAFTCPLPRQLTRVLGLIGEPSGSWKYSVRDAAAMTNLVRNEFVGVDCVLDPI